MEGLSALNWFLPALALVGVICVAAVLSFIPVRLWIEARFSGVPLGIGSLIGMRLRKVSPPTIVRPLIAATKAGLNLEVNELEAHGSSWWIHCTECSRNLVVRDPTQGRVKKDDERADWRGS